MDGKEKNRDGRAASPNRLSSSTEPQERLGPAGFDPARTCGSCAFIGNIYWTDETHHCLRSAQRRSDNFRSCGDFAEDFMSEFRRFYDAKAGQKSCRHYEARPPLSRELLDLLREVERTGEAGFVAEFFSRENALLSPLRDKFVSSDFAYPQEPARGERRYRLTRLGAVEVSRDRDGARSAETACPAPVPQDRQARAEGIAQPSAPPSPTPGA